MFKSTIIPYTLNFKTPGGTSRGVLRTKDTFFLVLNEINGNRLGIGECALFKGLSVDDRPNYQVILQEAAANLEKGMPIEEIRTKYKTWPSIVFGLETALQSYNAASPYYLFPTKFAQGMEGIKMNGLVWMGDYAYMKEQLDQKLDQGFRCIKIKVGAIDFAKELDLLAFIRSHFNVDEVEIRVDANGAFKPDRAMERLWQLAEFDLHSIEQPIQAGQWEHMRHLTRDTPLPIALDEELIGIFDRNHKLELLESIQPQYIILKPALVGGFESSAEWIVLAERSNIKWWITSALESNVGLNAIAQFVAQYPLEMPQGLGTGQLFTNNFDSPLLVQGDQLVYTNSNWDLSKLNIHVAS